MLLSGNAAAAATPAAKVGMRDAPLRASRPAFGACFGDGSNFGAGMCDDKFVADESTSEGAAKAEPFTGVPDTMLDGVALKCAVAAPVWMR